GGKHPVTATTGHWATFAPARTVGRRQVTSPTSGEGPSLPHVPARRAGPRRRLLVQVRDGSGPISTSSGRAPATGARGRTRGSVLDDLDPHRPDPPARERLRDGSPHRSAHLRRRHLGPAGGPRRDDTVRRA